MCFGRFFSSKSKKHEHAHAIIDPLATHLPKNFYTYLLERNLLDGELHTLNSITDPGRSFTITVTHLVTNNENTTESVLVKFHESKNQSQIESAIYFQDKTLLLETVSNHQGILMKSAHKKVCKVNGLTQHESEQYSHRLQQNILCKIGLAVEAKPLPPVKIKLR